MGTLRGKYRIPSRHYDVFDGSGSAVLAQTFVDESLQRDARSDKELDAARGAFNGVLISLVFWIVLGLVVFGPF